MMKIRCVDGDYVSKDDILGSEVHPISILGTPVIVKVDTASGQKTIDRQFFTVQDANVFMKDFLEGR